MILSLSLHDALPIFFEFRYLLIVEKSLEIICGVLLLINRFTPLTLAILLPIVANIFLFHLFIDHSLLPLAIFLVIILSYLLFCYRKSFISLFEKNLFRIFSHFSYTC